MISRGVPDLYPESSKWYWLEWSQTELGDGVAISSVTWTVPVELTSDAEDQTGLTVGIRLSVDTGVSGSYYDVVCKITTNNDETLHETLRITVSDEGH